MRVSPGILGAGAAVLVAGVTAGNAFGTVPPMQMRGMHELLPQARTVAYAAGPGTAWPDHYPLITAAGRFEVHELGERGLYSQARYSYRNAYLAAYYPVEEAEPGYDLAWAAEGEPARVVEDAPEVVEVAVYEAPQPADGAPAAPAGAVVAQVTPRMIDVAAELALRH